MILYEELKQQINDLIPKVVQLGEALALEQTANTISDLEFKTTAADFWDDSNNSKKILQEISILKEKISNYDRLNRLCDDVLTLVEMCQETDDEKILDEAKETFEILLTDYNIQKLSTLLSGEYDKNNAILTFHAGAGGTEAQDWVEMIYRMYNKWAQSHNFKITVLDYLDGETAGIKSVTILVEGLYAYGFLKSESGVHRLVRISPFDSSGRRHTSFASLEVMPEINDDIVIEINDDDLKVDTYRASGAGGQHVNKTESAIRITHIPSGIVVACQNERSQHKNRDFAMKMLKSKLIEIKEREHLEKISDIKGEQGQIAWGYQIRSYVFMPYTLVKDHRTNFEVGNINAVMDGQLDGFINAYLTAKSLEQ